jgi:hypothetical protein
MYKIEYCVKLYNFGINLVFLWFHMKRQTSINTFETTYKDKLLECLLLLVISISLECSSNSHF